MNKLPLFVLLACLGASVEARDVTVGSEQPYRQGRYAAFAGPWSRWIDRSITDYSNAIRIRTQSWPQDTSIQWRFPDKFASTGVYGYNYVAYGQYWDIRPPQTLTPRKVADLHRLDVVPGVRYSGDPDHFNVLAEFFVTKKPGDIGSRVAEIGWLLHTPPRTWDYFRSGKQIGTYKDRFGAEWLVASHKDGAAGLYIKFAPKDGSSRLDKPIDALASMRWLAAKGEVPLDLYFNGFAIGIEPLRGSGSAVLTRFDVNYR